MTGESNMKKIRLSKSSVGKEEKLALARVIDNGYLGMGVEVQQFEQEIAAFLETKNEVVCVSSGTAALHLALQAVGVSEGDEVLVPSFTYVATFQAISATGAKPVSCDVSEQTGFLDLNDAESRITDKTKVIVAVHYGSSTKGMVALFELAKRYGLRVIEDAAHSFGCKQNDEFVGANGDIICFSFDGIKNITSGEGGAVVTSDTDVAQRVKDARLLGVVKDTEQRFLGQRSWDFDVVAQGWRYHMSDLMAAIGREQLKKINHFSSCRKKISKRYISELGSLPQIVLMDFDYDNIVPHIFPIRIINGSRDAVALHLSELGIETGRHYQSNHLLSFYSAPYPLLVAEKLAKQILALPIHPDISDAEQASVIAAIKSIFGT